MRDDGNKKTACFITGASRVIGADIASAVLEAGNAGVTTGRDADRVAASQCHPQGIALSCPSGDERHFA